MFGFEDTVRSIFQGYIQHQQDAVYGVKILIAHSCLGIYRFAVTHCNLYSGVEKPNETCQ